MASGRFLLDTNIVIALLAEDPAVKQRITDAAEVFSLSIVLGELYYGARKSTRVESNVQTSRRRPSSGTYSPYNDRRNRMHNHLLAAINELHQNPQKRLTVDM